MYGTNNRIWESGTTGTICGNWTLNTKNARENLLQQYNKGHINKEKGLTQREKLHIHFARKLGPSQLLLLLLFENVVQVQICQSFVLTVLR